MQRQALQQNGVDATHAASSTSHGKTLEAAKNFRCVIKEDLVGDLGIEHRPVDFRPCFNHERKVAVLGQVVEHFSRIGSAAGAVSNQNFDTQILKRFLA